MKVGILGTGSYVPEKIMTNDDLWMKMKEHPIWHLEQHKEQLKMLE